MTCTNLSSLSVPNVLNNGQAITSSVEIQGDGNYSKTGHHVELIQVVKYAYILPSTYNISFSRLLQRSGMGGHWIEKFCKEQARLSAKCVTLYSLICIRSFLKCSTNLRQMSTAITLLILSAKICSWVLISQTVTIVLAVPHRGSTLLNTMVVFGHPRLMSPIKVSWRASITGDNCFVASYPATCNTIYLGRTSGVNIS